MTCNALWPDNAFAWEVKSLKLEIEHMGLEHVTLLQEIRALESRIRNKDQELLTIYHRSSEHDQELLRHCNLLREVEDTSIAKAQGLENLEAAKA
jgi:hypothetical protein